MGKRLKIFTWNAGRNYLYHLSRVNADFYLPFDPMKGAGYSGRSPMFFGQNVKEVNPPDVRQLEFDCILFQSRQNYLIDQHILFSPDQHIIPKVYLEHDPPHLTPAGTSHVVEDPDMILVHVSHFNRVMWDNNHTPSYVIEQGVIDNDIIYSGEIERGIVVLDQPLSQEREIGQDILREVMKKIPIDIIGPESESFGGLGEVPINELPEFMARYRFYFSPTRHASPSLSMFDAMMAGIPVVGLAAGNLADIVANDKSGFISCDIKSLISEMTRLLEHPDHAANLGRGAREIATARFTVDRFIKEWEALLEKAASRSYPPRYFAEILKNLS
jgi:glycosyltransferase involved in cell wall biosynthesis